MKKFFLILFGFAFFFIGSPGADAAIIMKSATTTANLIGWWTFDEGTSTYAGDFSANRYTGTLSGFPTISTATSGWVNGRRGKALAFDGTNDHVSTSNKVLSTSDFSFSVWVKNGSASQALDTTILSNQIDSGNHGVVFTNRTGSGNGWNVFYGNGSGSWIGLDLDKFALPVGEWKMVTFTKVGALTSIYINDQLLSSRTQSTATVSWAANNMYFGNSLVGVGAGSRYFNGSLDDIRFYNKPLNSSEVSALFKAGEAVRKSADKTGMAAYWPMNEGTSTIAGDFSGNGRTASFNNMDAATDWVAGRRGKALDFDGSDDHLTGTIPAATFSGDFTIAAWFNHRALTTWAGIFSNSVGTSDTAIMTFRNNTTQFGIMRVGVSEAQGTYLDLGADHYGKWIYGVVRRRGSALTVNAYEDGQLSTATGTLDWTINTDSEFYIGRHYAGATQIFNGQIDDVRVYSRAISDAEVQRLYESNETKINAPQDNKLTSGLVGYWTFNGKDVGSTIFDVTGQGNRGYVINVATTSILSIGKVGQGISLNGSTSYIDTGTGPGNISTNKVTVAGWVRPNSSASIMTLLSNDRDCGGCGSYMGYGLQFFYGGTSFFRIWNDNGSGPYTASTATNPPVGEWSHVAGTFDGTTIRYYMNGVQLSSSTSVGNGTLGFPSSFNTKIGQLGCCVSTYTMNGKIDEVRVYNRALSAAEVKQLYLMGK